MRKIEMGAPQWDFCVNVRLGRGGAPEPAWLEQCGDGVRSDQEVFWAAATEAEWNRVAGWWAGEGCINPLKESLREDRFLRSLTVTIAQKELDVLFWLQNKFGGGISWSANQAVASWRLGGKPARWFLHRIFSLLPESPRRRRQILDALCPTAGPPLRKGGLPSNRCRPKGHVKGPGRCQTCIDLEKGDGHAAHRERGRIYEQRYKDKKRELQNG